MQTVELRVSMHCNGCARKVHKHISKMEGTLIYLSQYFTGSVFHCNARVFALIRMPVKLISSSELL
jgi:copper chaperone CopZ